jgi:hypothetical protein
MLPDRPGLHAREKPSFGLLRGDGASSGCASGNRTIARVPGGPHFSWCSTTAMLILRKSSRSERDRPIYLFIKEITYVV